MLKTVITELDCWNWLLVSICNMSNSGAEKPEKWLNVSIIETIYINLDIVIAMVSINKLQSLS